MRLAVLSDIHGNLTAIKRCFEFIDNSNIDGLVFCGDYISDIPQSKEILDYIRVKSNEYKTWIVRGNREEYIINYHLSPEKNWTLESNNGAILFAYNSLNEEDINYLKRLPKYEIIDIPNTDKIYLTHRYRDIKYNDDFDYKFVIFGHEHNQLYFSTKGIRFFNPGSAGLPTDGFPGSSLLILEYKDNSWIPTFHHLEYDISIPINIIKNSNINHPNIRWGDTIIKMLQTGFDCTGEYIREVKRLAAKQGLSTILEEVPYDIWAEARKKLNLD
ncbi:MAG: metallophosphoesterase family protein [Bacilli bacterium]|nr:metallophosphoesterase family protein [Bacilli bacterium]MDD4282340.1 metallophosphoesterase family protein [Bacilli bacterium]MDD4718967.1 metallophosphoesterase family protein [Bacilli bacterium]